MTGDPIVITGMGCVTPVGLDVQSTWKSLLEGQSGVGPIQRFDAQQYPVQFAAEVPNFEVLVPENCSEFTRKQLQTLKGKLAYKAALEAMTQARLTVHGPRFGVSLGSEAARPEIDLIAKRFQDESLPSVAELRHHAPQAPAQMLAEVFGAEGPVSVVSTACTSSSQAVGEGLLRLRRGDLDAMLVGGVDVLVDPLMVTGFALLGALSTRNDAPQAASRPFDSERNGFVLGEGAGMLVLETLQHAQQRGVQIIGVLRGYGCSCNAYRITDSPPDGRGAAQSMQSALLDAGLKPSDIGYINAHGTSTLMNDASESKGIHWAFGSHATSVYVSSTKSMMGHLVAACGAVEAIIALMAARTGRLPPTINLNQPDVECNLKHVQNHSVAHSFNHALTNAFGFGGSNGSLVLSRWA